MSTPEIEVRAKALGWWPKEQFRGDPERWVDAPAFVERAEQILPVVKKDRERLESEVSTLKGDLQKAQTLLKASAEAIEELKSFNSAANKKATEGKKDELVAAIADANRAGEFEKAEQLTDQLIDVKLALREAKAKPAITEAPKPNGTPTGLDPTQDKAWQEWSKDKEWMKDPEKLGAANGISARLRNEGERSQGEEFWNKVEERINQLFGGNVRREAPSKTEGGSRGTGESGSGSGHTYADLPSEARATCERMGKRLVGEGRAYKTMADWKKAYVERFNWE